MSSLRQQPFRIVLVAPVIVPYDAISAAVRDTYRVLAAEPDIEIIALTWRNEFPCIRSRIVGDVSDLLLDEDFLAADAILYQFGIYAPLFDAMLVGNGRAHQIVRFHNITPTRFLGREHHNTIDRSFRQLANFQCVDEIWADSQVNADELLSRGFDREKLRVVPLAVESPTLALLSKKQASPVELLFVGRMFPSKGVLDLVLAIQQVRQRTKIEFRLRIAGNREWSDKAYLAQVESAIIEGRLGGIVQMVGTADDAALECLYHEAHVFVIPSYHEGFCKPVVEALRAGCVPVGYRSYNLPHITNGFGRMVPPGNIEFLASALVEIIEGVSRGLRALEEPELEVDCGRLSLAAFDAATKAYVKDFSLARFSQTVVVCVRKICGRPASELDLYDDQAIQDATSLPRDELLWLPQRADAISDSWSAARYCIDLLRSRLDLRSRFPRAFSVGATSDFLKWITSAGADELLLSENAQSHIKAIFERGPSARARQTFWARDDLKTAFPMGPTPAGRCGLFRWFMRHGKTEGNLRLEEIWWFFLESVEDPARELVRTYLFTPEWQESHPDGLTIFGRRSFATWLAERFRIRENWINPDEWPVEMTPAQQIRLAYHARENWQQKHPDALTTSNGAHGLLTWLTTSDADLCGDARKWCSKLNIATTTAELIAPGVNIIGHFCYPSGLRTSVEAIRDGLSQAGIALSLRDIRTDQNDDPNHTDYSGMEFYDTTILHLQPEPFFDVVFQRADLFERSPRTYRIAYWYWELDTIPESWLVQWKVIDEVWAATNFVADALRHRFGTRVHTMFPGIQLEKFQPRPRSYFGLTSKNEFTFLFLFHLTSVMERKNPLGLIRTFKQAFSANEPVRLVLKTSFGDRYPASLDEIRSAAAGAKITVIDGLFSKDETLSLIDTCDAYVSLHRSEGLGLTMAEAMLLGKPVIGTRYSGNMDFMDDTNSLLVDYRLVRLDRTIPPYDADARWAEPSADHAARLMRQVYENRGWAAELGAKAKIDANARMSLQVAGKRMAERLLQISDERHRRKTFQAVYKDKLWGTDAGSRFYSGVGSRGEPAITYVDAMAAIISIEVKDLQRVATIVDLGCGDFSVASQLLEQLPPVQYIGCDVVPELIEHNQIRYGSNRVHFQTLDIVSEKLPDGDICLVRQVFQHLPNRDIAYVLPKLRKYRYVYVTEGQPIVREGSVNPDKQANVEVRFDWRTGRGRGVELDQPPWNLALEEICRVPGPAHDKELIITHRLRFCSQEALA
jgi:glycosyltransferase involved in cell wall biosynthesis